MICFRRKAAGGGPGGNITGATVVCYFSQLWPAGETKATLVTLISPTMPVNERKQNEMLA